MMVKKKGGRGVHLFLLIVISLNEYFFTPAFGKNIGYVCGKQGMCNYRTTMGLYLGTSVFIMNHAIK